MRSPVLTDHLAYATGAELGSTIRSVHQQRSRLPSLIAVVVPAHNEERRIGHSIRAIERAASHPLLRQATILPVVVLDACQDETAVQLQRSLRSFRGPVLEVAHRNVGAARRAGIDHVLGRSAGLHLDDVWIAMTDADTLVDHQWLIRQLEWWLRGASAIAGTVRPYVARPSQRRLARYSNYMERLGMGFGHPHVHGANMAFTASAYLDAGGIEPLATAEDLALWNALRNTGRQVLSVGDVIVRTSARKHGRAPLGFAEFLHSFEPVPNAWTQ